MAKEKPVWIHAAAMMAIAKELSLEEHGVGVELFVSMWSAGETALTFDPVRLHGRLRLTEADRHITPEWLAQHWPGISKLFLRRADGSFVPNPILFAPASDDPPEEGQA